MRLYLRAALLLVYLLLMAAVIVGLFAARRYARQVYGTAAAQADWEQWVDNVKQQQAENASSVQRRVPRSPRPPALVLMEEHFLTCLTGALLLTTALYGTLAMLLYGALTSSASPADADQQESGR